MDVADFEKSMHSLVTEAQAILIKANKEYASDADTLANFKSVIGVDSELVAFIFMKKHVDGINNYVTGRAKVQRDSIRGRIIDVINYCILLNAIIEEKEKDDLSN